MKKVLWFPVMVMSIPLDFIGWNLIFGSTYGFRSFKNCISDNIKQWKEL